MAPAPTRRGSVYSSVHSSTAALFCPFSAPVNEGLSGLKRSPSLSRMSDGLLNPSCVEFGMKDMNLGGIGSYIESQKAGGVPPLFKSFIPSYMEDGPFI